MISIIEKNKQYLSLYLLFFLTLFMYQIVYYQTDALFFFSHHRSAFGDGLFLGITRLGEEFGFIVVALWFLYKKNRKAVLKIGVTGLVVLVVSQIMKWIFSHPRPITYMEQVGVIDKIQLVEGYILRGMNSFPSGHTTAGFALYSILAIHYSFKKNWQILFLVMAILVGISRVYLVAHFPEDVLIGSALGVSIALMVEYYFSTILFKKVPFETNENTVLAVNDLIKISDDGKENIA